MGRLGEGRGRSRSFLPIFFAVTPLPLLPEPIPKTVYPSVDPSLYLPLWDALQYLNRVSDTRALWERGGPWRHGGVGGTGRGHRAEIPSGVFSGKRECNPLHLVHI